MKKKTKLHPVVISLLLAFSAESSMGEQIFPASDNKALVRLDEVVVTATKSETELRNVTASVTMLSGEEIRESGARVLTDALHQTAGLQMNEWEGNGEFSMISMRGMPILNSQYVQVLVDGIPRNTATDIVSWGSLPMENVERVEIIKGPASALYGKSALGGVINIITKKGHQHHQGQMSAGYGSYDENQQKILLSGPLGQAGYSVGLTRRASEGWREENSSLERINGFARIDGRLFERTKAGVSLDHTTWQMDFPDYIPLANYQAGERKYVHFKYGTERHDETNASLTLEHSFCDNLQVVNRSYGQRVEKQRDDIVDVVNVTAESRRIGNEIQLITEQKLFGKKNQIMAGYHIESDQFDETRIFSQYLPAAARRGVLFRNAESSRLFNSLYFQDELMMSDVFTVTAGLRYDHVSIDLDNILNPAGSRESDFSQFSPKAGFVWTVNPTMSLFASVGTGFKAPVGSQIATNPDIKPEEAISYELGLKATLFQQAYVQLSLYHTDLKNQLAMVPNEEAHGTFRFDNAGKSKMQGFELETELILNHGFSILGSYTYNISEYKDFVDYAMDYSGNTLPWQPKHKAAVELRYAHSNGFGFSLSNRWVGDHWIDNENTFSMDAYNLVDAKLTYRKGRFECSLAARNIFDTDYIAAGENWGDGDIYVTPGDPLTVYGEITLRF